MVVHAKQPRGQQGQGVARGLGIPLAYVTRAQGMARDLCARLNTPTMSCTGSVLTL